MDLAPNDKDVVVKLSAADRQLILEHGFPLDELRRELVALAATRRDRLVSIKSVDLRSLIGELSFATNHASQRMLAEVLNDLCERLEWEERRARR